MTDAVIRTGTAADAAAIDRLIRSHQQEGHLLPRQLEEIRRRAGRFVVCEVDGTITGCAELAPLSASVAEIRSLVVSSRFRRAGAAARMVDEIARRARAGGFETLCAFTHDASIFVRHNFSIVPHLWLPDKIARDCAACPLFTRCGQVAMVLPLRADVRQSARDVERRRVAVA